MAKGDVVEADARPDSSVGGALVRAVEAAERIVVNRIDLARLDILGAITDVARTGGLLVCGGFLLAIGWTGVSLAGALLLERLTGSWPLSAALIGAVNLVLGCGAMAAASNLRSGAQPDAREVKNGVR
jgi:hypothetical protein